MRNSKKIFSLNVLAFPGSNSSISLIWMGLEISELSKCTCLFWVLSNSVMCIMGKATELTAKNISKVNFIYAAIYSVNHEAKPWRGEGRRDDVYKHELPESRYSEE